MIRLVRCERGNSLIEMAFALPLMVSLLIGMVDISRAVSLKLQTIQLTQRAIERVQRDNFMPSMMAAIEAEAEAAGGSTSSATMTAWLECGNSTTRLAWTATCSNGQAYARYVGIVMTNSFQPVYGTTFFPGSNGTVTVGGSAGVRVQ